VGLLAGLPISGLMATSGLIVLSFVNDDLVLDSER
jgi:hypothetical protein